MRSVRKALGLLVLGVVLEVVVSPALAQDITPVPPTYQGTYHVTVPEHDLGVNN
jgi:hypothetical protein